MMDLIGISDEQADIMACYAMEEMNIKDITSSVKNRIKRRWKEKGYIKQSKLEKVREYFNRLPTPSLELIKVKCMYEEAIKEIEK